MDVTLESQLEYVLSVKQKKKSSFPVRLFLQGKTQIRADNINDVIANLVCCLHSLQNPADIYGIRTNGVKWEFYKVDTSNQLSVSPEFTINDTKSIVGVLLSLFNVCYPID
jgi:hypothetical protein